MIEDSSSSIQCYSPEESPFGYSFGAWTIKWWEWALSFPIPINPVLDMTGKYSDLGQNDMVWFLAGTIGDIHKIAHRKCIIPNQSSILFPVINYIRTEEPRFLTSAALVKHVQSDIDDIVVNEAFIDGFKVPIYRIKSQPLVFELDVKMENKLEIPSGITRASADGYWVFVKNLDIGNHEIYFHGACSGGIRNASASYRITIV